MSLKLVAAPAALAVDLAEAKTELRVPAGSSEDNLITRYIEAATSRAEHITGRAIIQQDWELILDAFPEESIRLARPRQLSILRVEYVDPTGTWQTLSDSRYTLDPDLLPGYLLPATGTTWPETLDVANAVKVRMRCGYGTSASTVPRGLQDWIMVQVATRYDNRDLVALSKADQGADSFGARLLDEFRVYG